MPYFTTDDGVRLYYQMGGTGSPTLLFVHGWCSNLRHWEPQARYFARRSRVLRLDRRGHGRSGVPEDSYDWPREVEDLASLARSLGIHDAVVIMHADLGSPAIQLAQRHPWLVRALVLDDGPPNPLPGLPGYPSMLERVQQLLGGPDYPEQMRAFYSRTFSDATERRLVARCAEEAARTPQRIALSVYRSLATTDTAAFAKELGMPVLCIAGGYQGVQVTAPALRKVIPHAQFAQVVDSGHFVHLDVPDQFNAMLRRFIERLDAHRPPVSSG
jgi:pimeloyl-ACP methyl ester carboxylesterase